MTIVNVGVVFYAAYIPCFTAAIIAYGVAQLIGVTPTRFAVEAPAFEPAMVVRVVLLALACAVVVHLFCFVLHSAAHGLPKLLPNPWVRAFLGGCVVVVFTLLYGSMRYNGAGMNIIAAAVEQGQALPWDWIVKIMLTALTLSSGFKGGEVVPSFLWGQPLAVWPRRCWASRRALAQPLGWLACSAVPATAWWHHWCWQSSCSVRRGFGTLPSCAALPMRFPAMPGFTTASCS